MTTKTSTLRAPKRVQLRRTKGWRKPEGTIVVSRPSRWGNIYRASDYQFSYPDGTHDGWRAAADVAREMAVRDFEHAIGVGGILPFTTEDVRRELRGRDLACWCPLSKACHADVLLEVANQDDALLAAGPARRRGR